MRSALEQAERPERSCCCAPWCPQPCAGAAGRATPAAAPIPALTASQRASKHTEIFGAENVWVPRAWQNQILSNYYKKRIVVVPLGGLFRHIKC